MDFIINLLNSIYALIIGILSNAGVPTDGLPEVLVPTDKAE